MKLTIYTTANSAYFPFAKLFLHSLKDNFPEEKINRIVINDLGLSGKEREQLKSIHNKIDYIKTNEESVGKLKVHTKEWREAVDEKTKGLESLCREENYPILMIDADTYVFKDFSDEIFDDCDIQVCKNKNDVINGQGYYLTHIASWFVVNNQKGADFVKRWRKTMPEINSAHVETPALCETLKYSAGLFKIKDNDQSLVSSLKYGPNSKIVHFRSNPIGDGKTETVEDRINNVSDLPEEFINKRKFYIPNTFLKHRERLNNSDYKMEKHIDSVSVKYKEKIEACGFSNLHEKIYQYAREVDGPNDGSTCLLDCNFLQTLCWEKKPKNILEIGTYVGATTYAMAFATVDDKTEIHTVDFREDDKFYYTDLELSKRINVWSHMSSSQFLDNATLQDVGLFFIDAYNISDSDHQKMYEIGDKSFIYAVHDYYSPKGSHCKGYEAITNMMSTLDKNNGRYQLFTPKKEWHRKGYKNINSGVAFLMCEKK
tara:strand:- start:115 stop:1572 length:1458 start_codon:yes stop_codon:yes gene_type:complete